MYTILALISLSVTGSALANAPQKQITKLTLLHATKGKIVEKEIDYAKVDTSHSHQIVSPHPSRNPKKLTQHWSGTLVRELLSENGIRPGQGTPITFIGMNSYAVQIYAEDVAAFDVLLAVERDGKRLQWFDGGQQLVYPINDARMPAFYKIDSWWCWYVNGIVVGVLPPKIRLEKGGGVTSLDLRDAAGVDSRTMKRSYPPGQRRDVVEKTDVQVSYLPLSSLFAGTAPSRLSVTNFLGNVVELTQRDLAAYEIRFAWAAQPIAPAFGGPLQLCRGGSGNDCVYYVNAIRTE